MYTRIKKMVRSDMRTFGTKLRRLLLKNNVVFVFGSFTVAIFIILFHIYKIPNNVNWILLTCKKCTFLTLSSKTESNLEKNPKSSAHSRNRMDLRKQTLFKGDNVHDLANYLQLNDNELRSFNTLTSLTRLKASYESLGGKRSNTKEYNDITDQKFRTKIILDNSLNITKHSRKTGETFTTVLNSVKHSRLLEKPNERERRSSTQLRSHRRNRHRGTRRRNHGRRRKIKLECNETSTSTLRKLLGPAFNARYMAMRNPSEIETRASTESLSSVHIEYIGIPRTTQVYEGLTQAVTVEETEPLQQDEASLPSTENSLITYPFRVPSGFTRELPLDFFLTQPGKLGRTKQIPSERFLNRIRRNELLPWKCESKMTWRDLGEDHFPRFLKSVECTSPKCWWSNFNCVPKSFTVTVLKRKSDACVPVISGPRNETKLEQEWVFEEVYLTFCCDCVEP